MAQQKVSLITTERNEKAAIVEFLDSVLAQSRKPDEIIIADAASTDGTVEIVKQYAKQHSIVKLVNAPGNRSVGRNAAIAAAHHPIIAVTDVGCRLDKDWLKNITAPFEHGAEVVSGLFLPEPKTFFERVSTALMLDRPDSIDVDTWLPSSRSIAFTKAAWERAGRYPEYEEFGDAKVARLCGGEDTLYDLQLRRAGYRFHDGLKAIVYWRPRPNLVEFFKQYRMYTIGDGIRLVDLPHFRRLTLKWVGAIALLAAGLIWWQPLVMAIIIAVLVAILAFDLSRRVLPKWRPVGGIGALALMCVLTLTYDLAQIIGFWTGYYHRAKLPAKRRLRFEA